MHASIKQWGGLSAQPFYSSACLALHNLISISGKALSTAPCNSGFTWELPKEVDHLVCFGHEERSWLEPDPIQQNVVLMKADKDQSMVELV